MKKILFFLVALSFLHSGCSDEKGQSRNTVLHYNSLLAEGYRTMNMNHITTIATSEQAMKVYYHMAALGEGGVRMDAFLRNIEFDTYKKNDRGKSEVTTRETWIYKYMNIESGETGRESIINYQTRYFLVKQEGKWLVADLLILSTDKEDDSGMLPFLKRPGQPLLGNNQQNTNNDI